MRLKNVKGASEKIESSKYIVKDYLNCKGKYKELFNNDNPIYIEIGMGKGTFIINNAISNPNINYIGIEKYDSVIVRAVEKLENEDIPNLRLIRFDATDIDKIFDKEIDLIYLNFSDPWPKERHANRRLASIRFLKRYEKIFKEKNRIIMKTDNRKLFEFSLISLVEFGYKINSISLNLHQDDVSNNIETEYEKKFSNLGYPIYFIDVEK